MIGLFITDIYVAWEIDITSRRLLRSHYPARFVTFCLKHTPLCRFNKLCQVKQQTLQTKIECKLNPAQP
ncbi:MAG: hypothetical protein Fur0016_14520 [Anaerolineales bacterium]